MNNSEVVVKLEQDKFLTRTLFNNFGSVIVFIFYAEWNEPSKNFKERVESTVPVFGQFPNVKYFTISAQVCPQTFKKYNVESTPTVIMTQTDKQILSRYEGDDVGFLFDSINQISQKHKEDFEKEKQIWHPKIKSILSSCPVIVFIKGTPQNPKCGFTETFLSILKQNDVNYTHYDIIEDEYMRYWLRNYSNWATYPQLYVNGKIIGGLQTLKQLAVKGEIQKIIPESSKNQPAEQRYQKLIEEHQYLVITKGFTFQDRQTEKYVKEVESKGINQAFVYNAEMDNQMMDYLKSKKILLPVLISNKVPQV